VKKPAQPSDMELQILSVLWEEGPSTVRDVLGALPDGKPRAYTTVLSMMQVMEKKGLLAHSVKGKTHIYRPRVKRQQVLGPMLQGIVQNVFGGKPSGVLQCLLEARGVSDEELDAIHRLIEEHDDPASQEGGGEA
jgi:BlaI family transcriptional regulator, penicillinase repressor